MRQNEQMLYENANRYRIHQDTLRWSLAAGYAGSFAATLAGLRATYEAGNPWVAALISLGFFVFGNVYLLVLAVEDWYYNLFAEYVQECEHNLLGADASLRTLSDFADKEHGRISPLHPSYAFVLLLVAISNSIYLVSFTSCLALVLRPSLLLGVAVLGSVPVACLYLAFCRSSVEHWNERIYERVVEPLQNLYKPERSRNEGGDYEPEEPGG